MNRSRLEAKQGQAQNEMTRCIAYIEQMEIENVKDQERILKRRKQIDDQRRLYVKYEKEIREIDNMLDGLIEKETA